MRKTKNILFTLVFLIFFSSTISSQNSVIKSFFKISYPEKYWVISHPFKAKKAFVISNNAKLLSDSIKNTNILDGDANGGQVDAFRHSYWMATLAKKIGTKSAKKLGIKHEKGNYIYYKKNKTEDGEIPDKISSEMDLMNNKAGIQIYENNKNLSNKEIEKLLIKKILAGELRIIKKNNKGDYLDCKGKIIPKEELKGKWENNKCLIFSDGKEKNLFLL